MICRSCIHQKCQWCENIGLIHTLLQNSSEILIQSTHTPTNSLSYVQIYPSISIFYIHTHPSINLTLAHTYPPTNFILLHIHTPTNFNILTYMLTHQFIYLHTYPSTNFTLILTHSLKIYCLSLVKKHKSIYIKQTKESCQYLDCSEHFSHATYLCIWDIETQGHTT